MTTSIKSILGYLEWNERDKKKNMLRVGQVGDGGEFLEYSPYSTAHLI